ncbi:MAG: M28 family peptidase [Bacteroidia bacterium]
MKLIYSFILVVFTSFTVNSQTPHPVIIDLLKELNLDSLTAKVNDLSGENTCFVNGKVTTIKNRVSKTGNDVAAEYLKEHLQALGLTVTDQKYSTGGRNIIAEQKGTLYPDKKYIICAHYDAVADYCADDNVSGCSAILEAAKLLSKHEFKNTIVYAFWDEEEIGLVGSKYYANEAKKNKENIAGVLNIEMLGYDSDNDFLMDIHTKDVANSIALSTKLKEINTTYKFKLKTNIKNPGTDRSDHGSFWTNNFGAICFGEAFFSGDDNPTYHKATDRISKFNLPYFYELSKLSLAAIATLAEPVALAIDNVSSQQQKVALEAFPNPAQESVTVCYSLPLETTTQLSIYNPISDVNNVIINEKLKAGEYQYNITTSNLTNGVYIISLKTSDKMLTKKLVVQN